MAEERAKAEVVGLTAEAEVGKIYKGKVKRILGIGVFVEIMPGKEGLVRMNQLADKFVEKAEDVVKEGEEIEVKVLEVDMQGRINLSRKAVTHPGSELQSSGGRSGGGDRGGRSGGPRREPSRGNFSKAVFFRRRARVWLQKQTKPMIRVNARSRRAQRALRPHD